MRSTYINEPLSPDYAQLELAFTTKELRAICEIAARAAETYAPPVAEALRHRLADLSAAPTVSDVIAGRPQVRSDPDCMSVEFSENHRLVFRANHQKKPTRLDGAVDWAKVSRIKILCIEDDYDK